MTNSKKIDTVICDKTNNSMTYQRMASTLLDTRVHNMTRWQRNLTAYMIQNLCAEIDALKVKEKEDGRFQETTS